MAAVLDPNDVEAAVAKPKKKRLLPNGMGRAAKKGKNQVVLYVNPKFAQFNRPCLLATVIGGITLVLWLVLTDTFLKDCKVETRTATARSELMEWFLEPAVGALGTPFFKNNKFNNWNCIYYTSKLSLSSGNIEMTCATKTVGEGRTKEAKKAGECDNKGAWKAKPGLLRYQKCDLGTYQVSGSGVPEGTERSVDWVWLDAAGVRSVPGAAATMGPHDGPWCGGTGEFAALGNKLFDFVISAPYTGWAGAGQVLPSQFPYHLDGSGKDCTRLYSQIVPYTGGDLTASEIETLETTSLKYWVRIKDDSFPASSKSNLANWEFRILQRVAVVYDEPDFPNEILWEGRHLNPDMLCNAEDYNDYIVFKDPIRDCQPGGYYDTGTPSDLARHKRCSNIRKCDMSDFFRGPTSGTAAQSEYGSFLVSYEICPDFMETVGISLGYTGQIELILTIIFLTFFLCTGIVIKKDTDGAGPKGWKAMMKAHVETAMSHAEDVDEVGDNIAELQAKAAARESKEAQATAAKAKGMTGPATLVPAKDGLPVP